MKLVEFNYSYPEELIATYPLPDRDASRMLVADRKTGGNIHSRVQSLPDFLKNGDLLIINDTKVFPARLIGKKESGGRVELLLLSSVIPAKHVPACSKRGAGISCEQTRSSAFAEDDNKTWCCITNQTAKLKPGTKLFFEEGLIGIIISRENDQLIIEFNKPELIEQAGLPPLPPYILAARKKNPPSPPFEKGGHGGDLNRYQTIYARHTGSAAAPTAGLHFTDELLQKIKSAGANIATVTMHVGLDTFSPVRVENIEDHKMHGEEYFVPPETVEAIERTKDNGGRVIAVGTTSVRALESFWIHRTPPPIPSPLEGEGEGGGACFTNLFITPGYKFRIVDAMLTNFHQPKSTLLMLVSAFASREFIMQVYQEAITQKYRLFSYGDCMLII